MNSLLTYVTELYQQYALLTKDNQFLGATVAAGAMAALAMGWRHLLALGRFARSRFIVSMVVRSDDTWDSRYDYMRLSTWLSKRTMYLSRFFTPVWYEENGVTNRALMAESLTFFFWRGSIYWTFVSMGSNDSSSVFKRTLVVSSFAFTRRPIQNIYEEVFPDEAQVTGLVIWHAGLTTITRPLTPRKLESVIMRQDRKLALVTAIEEWLSAETGHKERGLAWKLGICLYGPPGCGKTALARAVAHNYGMSLNVFDLRQFTDSQLLSALLGIRGRAVILFDEIDQGLLTSRSDVARVNDQYDKRVITAYGSNSLTPEEVIERLGDKCPNPNEVYILYLCREEEFSSQFYVYDKEETLSTLPEVRQEYRAASWLYDPETSTLSQSVDPNDFVEALEADKEIREKANTVAPQGYTPKPKGVTLGGLLTAIDGAIELHGKIIFFNTNQVHTLDPALARPGRIDYKIEVPAFGPNEVREFTRYYYYGEIPESLAVNYGIPTITGAELQQLYSTHKRSVQDFALAVLNFTPDRNGNQAKAKPALVEG